MKTKTPSAAAADTRNRLLTAAIDAFGRKGYDGASIREIAAAADTNLAGIAYHFGGKDKLYRACLSHIVSTIADRVGTRLEGRLANPSETPEAARLALKAILGAMAEVILATPRLSSFARVIVREQMDPSPAFAILYDSFMAPMHARLCGLWGAATGKPPESDEVKLAVFTLVGGVLVFRITRAGTLKRLGWKDIGPTELKSIIRRLEDNVDLLTERT
ncbi:MAG TPA: CerR family C-terminal domain-containing protein [Aestuariivirgaceae bacterium]|nr:CerR family C-terminal domain-containing protein [Aestuariivirgaceae bacterium]